MIIVVYGLPATGKSWFSKQLSKKLDIPYLSTDIIREQAGLTGRYDSDTKQQVYDKLINKARDFIRYPGQVIVDGTFHKKQRREKFDEIADQENCQIFFIEIKASERVIRERLKTSREHSEADFKVYKQLELEYEPSHRDHLILWNNSASIDEFLRKTLEYIKNKQAS